MQFEACISLKALAKICVTGIGNFREYLRAPAGHASVFIPISCNKPSTCIARGLFSRGNAHQNLFYYMSTALLNMPQVYQKINMKLAL